MIELEIPTKAEREYFRAFGIVALFLAASSTRMPCLIGFSRDLGRSLESIRSRWHWSIVMTHAWWVADEDSARKIVETTKAPFPVDDRGRFDAHVDTVAVRMVRVADSLGVALTEHANAMRRVQLAVARVDSVIEAANVAGELRWFNRAYRQWRTTAGEDMAMSLPYALARSRLRAAVVRRIARGGDHHIGPDLLSDIFPQPDGDSGAVNSVNGGGPQPDIGRPAKPASALPNGNARLRRHDTMGSRGGVVANAMGGRRQVGDN